MAELIDSIEVKVHVDTSEVDAAIEKVRMLGNLENPVYVVHLSGCYRYQDMLAKKKSIEEQLDGTVVVVDRTVDCIEQLSPASKSKLAAMLAGEMEDDLK